jgi:hypothetical protein
MLAKELKSGLLVTARALAGTFWLSIGAGCEIFTRRTPSQSPAIAIAPILLNLTIPQPENGFLLVVRRPFTRVVRPRCSPEVRCYWRTVPTFPEPSRPRRELHNPAAGQ